MIVRILGQEKLFLAYKILSEMEDEDKNAWEKMRRLGRQRENLVEADSHNVYSN